jgi:hypothetical protein
MNLPMYSAHIISYCLYSKVLEPYNEICSCKNQVKTHSKDKKQYDQIHYNFHKIITKPVTLMPKGFNDEIH